MAKVEIEIDMLAKALSSMLTGKGGGWKQNYYLPLL